jgi:XTP/dITP diphosphohydrolase
MRMALTFVTGNDSKYNEAKVIIPDLLRYNLDLVEMQETDPEKIIRDKLEQAKRDERTHKHYPIVVEDVSLYLEFMRPFPGPLIKFFIRDKGLDWLYKQAQLNNDYRAEVVCMLGYAPNPSTVHIVKSSVPGTIVSPRGETTFAWDPIFVPRGETLTYAQMGKGRKQEISHRTLAFQELKSRYC